MSLRSGLGGKCPRHPSEIPSVWHSEPYAAGRRPARCVQQKAAGAGRRGEGGWTRHGSTQNSVGRGRRGRGDGRRTGLPLRPGRRGPCRGQVRDRPRAGREPPIERGEAADSAYAERQDRPRRGCHRPRSSPAPPPTARRVHRPVRAGHDLPRGAVDPREFGGAAEVQAEATLPIPEGIIAISVNLTDTARVAGVHPTPAPRSRILPPAHCLPPTSPTSTRLLLDVLGARHRARPPR